MPHENMSIMEAVTTQYGKKKTIKISKSLASLLGLLFFVCLIATGILVYSFTSCSKTTAKYSEAATATTAATLSTEETVTSSTVTDTIDITTEETIKTDLELDLDVRLPKTILPHSYKLKLIPFLQENNFTFHGEVKILINVTDNVKKITLHSDGLTIHTAGVTDTNSNTISIRDVREVRKKQFLIIDLDEELESNRQYYVLIVFDGVLSNRLEGFYRSSYVENKKTRWIAATQFQATDARKAFPCFDEPAMKSRFQISIGRLRNMNSISNMRKVGGPQPVENLPEYVWDNYEESPPMSTYLVAFIVSDFQSISKGKFSIWARPSALSQAEYSLAIGPVILKYYEDFFNITYPLPKLDMVAIPDFSAGAMENWGLITYREVALLYQKGVSSRSSLQMIAHVVAHELAHQWFGNLVTPIWWEDLWLNEGFATYVEFLGANAVQPEWKDDLFLVNELHSSLILDELKTSHPISVEVNNPNEINDIFDSISYSKGASIIRMMQNFLTPEVFHRGLNKYLRNRMYSNADQDYLWQTFTDQSHEDQVLDENITIKEIMDTWTLQTGFPLVTAQYESSSNSLTLTQERFLLETENKNENSLWWIPITYTDSKKNFKQDWMMRTKKMILEQDPGNTWYLLNVNQTGYYRVNYERDNWQRIISQLQSNHEVFDPKNRAQLLDDSLSLAYAGYIDYDIALNITTYLLQEREYVPWKAALNNMDFLRNMFLRSGRFENYKKYMLSLIIDFYHELGFKESSEDSPLTVLNRMEMVEQACNLGLRDCILNAVQMFQNWKNSANPDQENTISPDLRPIVYCTAIRDGGQEEWDFAWERYLNTNVANEKEILLTALGCSREIWLLSRYLEWSITENSGIRRQDSAMIVASVSRNPVGHLLAYRFLKSNWSRIRNYLGSSSMSLSSIVSTSTANFNTEEDLNDFASFFKSKYEEFGIAQRTARQSLEHAKANVRWMNKHFNTVSKWLDSVKK